MAKPTEKSQGIKNFLEETYGRSTAIEADVCIPVPTGCGGPAVEFKDEISRREYRISGFCQACQDKVFG